MRFGYGIEHIVVEPTQIFPSLETKLIRNLYLAGQINALRDMKKLQRKVWLPD